MSFVLPDLKAKCSGWIDHDRKILVNPKLSLRDKVFYFENRFNLVFFRPMDRVFLNSAPKHKAVNDKNMSFFLLGTTVLCCAIEAVGGYLLGAGRNKERGINGRRFKEFLRCYLPRWHKTTTKGTPLQNWMWDNLRNPLAHSLSIASGGMAYLHRNRYRERRKGKVEVHTEILYKDFKKAFSKYTADVTDQTNPSLANNFESRFKEVFIDSHDP